jgi:hypothetical protein
MDRHPAAGALLPGAALPLNDVIFRLPPDELRQAGMPVHQLHQACRPWLASAKEVRARDRKTVGKMRDPSHQENPQEFNRQHGLHPKRMRDSKGCQGVSSTE